MWREIFLCLLQCLNLSYVLCDGTYECGDHGRFEYCIDEIPGCIIGCHCHPGYYFDTDTKICEPNSKLIEHHRRHYVPEPTRILNNIMTPNSILITSPVATTSKIDGAVDEISKDAEDLGDWLYNQFFKTIENQVINNTNDKNALTRRSGSVQSVKKAKDKKKSRKRRKSKKKGKRINLRKKLLRITENDSAFDLSSSSNSDSSDSTSDSSDSSVEYYNHHDDDEHGHKKIVMIKKKPKEKLPNFIFLPNVETPFYPPLGLPPPPIPVPMYPVVPVPPMTPFRHIADDDSDDSDDETTVSPNKTTTVSTTTKLTSTTFISTTIQEDYTKAPDMPDDSQPNTLRRPSKKRRKELKISKIDETAEDLRSNKLRSPNRQQFLQHLKQRIQDQSAKSLIPPWKKNNHKKTITKPFIKQDANLEYPYLENTPDSSMMNYVTSNNAKQDPAFSDNVDFKYITELIHRVDQNNKSNNLPPIEYNPLDSIEVYQPSIRQDKFSDYIIPPNVPASRRFARPNIHQSDESYYMNLGRQIASLIRGIDTQNKEVNIKLETNNDIPKNDVYLNINSPRSYWERSVRSPLTLLKSNKKKFEYLKKSNELLFDIENKVEIIASTAPTLTLREIENIVNIMETANKNMQNKETNYFIPPRKNLNLKLWPQELSKANKLIRNSKLPELKNNIKHPNTESKANKSHNKENNILADLHHFSMVNTNRFAVQRYPQTLEIKTEMKPVYFNGDLINYYQIPQQALNNSKHIRPTFSEQNSRQSLWEHETRPPLLKHRKYFSNSHNFLVDRNEYLPYLEPKRGLKDAQRSYFHHEINDFDHI